jgi:nitrogen regulatory protein P-II 1
MKLVTAIIQPQRLTEVIDAAVAAGAHGLTMGEVHGFGQQYGRQHAGVQLASEVRQATLLPKTRVDVVVPDDRADAVAAAIAKSANTGTIGDGKIWVSPVQSVLRVRTSERDDAAL